MKISRNWLQTYFKENLPSDQKIADLFTFHSFEVEGIEKIGDDHVVDVKVLPDRAHDCLSYQGIAREFAAISGLNLKEKTCAPIDAYPQSKILELAVEDARCRRNIKAVIQNVEIKESPAWLKERLEAIGQRSINNAVDATNYVMFDVGQPLHAFDFDKLEKKNGKVKIVLRKANEGEKITLLGNKELILTPDILVFADGHKEKESALDIAGIKGGKLAEVDENTKNLVMLSDNFDPTYLRKTARRLGILTEASKRFENDPSAELAARGMSEVCELIAGIAGPKVKVEGIVEYYPHKENPRTIEVALDDVCIRLGTPHLSSEILENILHRLQFTYSKHGNIYSITVPIERKDLVLKENIVEEIGRLYGYDKIKPELPSKTETTGIHKIFYWSEKIKDTIVADGYSEVYTYVLTDHGDVEIQNPLASDKGFLRANVREGIEKTLAFNARNAPLLGLEEIKIFEIGNVFTKDLEEHLSISLGYFTTKNIKNKSKASWEILEKVIKKIGDEYGVELKGILESTEAGVIFEGDLSALIEKLPEPTVWDIQTPTRTVSYKPFSAYPFMLRDIAVFVPEGVSKEEPLAIIVQESGKLLNRHTLFDVFHKQLPDGTQKTSYAFRLVFESHERTLTDTEINAIMNRITDAMNKKPGWQVR